MATYTTIRDELETLAVLLQRPIPESDLEVISRTWAETFQVMADHDFRAALTHHRRVSGYWPTEADIFKAHAERPRECVAYALPERTWTESDGHWNAVCAAMVGHSIRGNARAREFFDGGRGREERDMIAREVLGEKYPKFRDSGRERHTRVSSGPRHISEILQ